MYRCQVNKLKSVFYAPILLLTLNFAITSSKYDNKLSNCRLSLADATHKFQIHVHMSAYWQYLANERVIEKNCIHSQSRTFRFFAVFSLMHIAVFATPILFNYSTWSLIVAWGLDKPPWSWTRRWLSIHRRACCLSQIWMPIDSSKGSLLPPIRMSHMHSNARELTKSVKIDQSEGVPDAGITGTTFCWVYPKALSPSIAAGFFKIFFPLMFSTLRPN